MPISPENPLNKPAHSIDYAPNRRRRIGRRPRYLILLATFALSGAIGFTLFHDQITKARRQWHLYGLQRQCEAWSAPPGQIVYDDDPYTTSRQLLQEGFSDLNPFTDIDADTGERLPCEATGRLYKPWIDFIGQDQGTWSSSRGSAVATVFLHRLRSHSGHERLVSIGVCHSTGLPPMPTLQIYVGTLGTPLTSAAQCSLERMRFWTYYGGCKLLTGQTDPADPSHFSFGLLRNKIFNTIDGWLLDDDTVFLQTNGHGIKGRFPSYSADEE